MTCCGPLLKTFIFNIGIFLGTEIIQIFNKTEEHIEHYLINSKQNCKNSHKVAHHTRKNAVIKYPAPS